MLLGNTNRAIYLVIRNCSPGQWIRICHSACDSPIITASRDESGYAPQFGYRMPMMASPLQFSSHSGARVTIPPQQTNHTPAQAAENPSGKKKNRWSDTEEKILTELFGENKDKLPDKLR